MTKTAELWWVSVGGNMCEPARVVDGKAFTIGCNDGTPISDGTVELVEMFLGSVPLPSKEAEARRIAWDRKIERDAKRGIFHSYRKF